ncbi:MAG TPA: threonine synthase [Arenimonas sp.]|nr:threonine synthase [Arenimonas sp.]
MILQNLKVPAQQVSFLQAVRLGLGEQQGLFFPIQWPQLDFDRLLALPFVERSAEILQALIGDEIKAVELQNLVRDAFVFPAPLVTVTENSACLELFHGPTLAFKDFGARIMARVLHVAQKQQQISRTTIVTATSGDTGAAVAQAFFEQPNVDVMILFPEGKISPLQEKLFTTLGGNIHTLAVKGDFDACQALVKQVFDDRELVDQLNINSANSINISRIFAQVCYYIEAFAQLTKQQQQNAVFAIPSGNFGNLTAGLIAKVLGLPIKRFIAATNSNDTVPRFLQEQIWNPHPTQATLSNAMDVSNPNNWPRIQHLLDGDLIARDALIAVAVSEQETIQTVKDLDAIGYLSEPHAAVAFHALQQSLQEGEYGIFLGTAHPAKFQASVEEILGRSISIPDVLRRASQKSNLNGLIAADYVALKAKLLDLT